MTNYPAGVVGTGKYVTPEELTELQELNKRARSTPVMAFGSDHAMRGGASGDARRAFYRRLYEITTAHGVPEPPDTELGLGLDGEILHTA